jgi:Cys-tRNA(Pro)/Cys-tRNA(Cys) deacylase
VTDAPPTTAPVPESVLRALDALDAPWTLVRHTDLDEPVRSAADVARQLGLDPGDITKTLLVTRRPGSDAHALVVVPVDGRMDPVAVAGTLGWEQIALASPVELARAGQTVGGVSPLGTPFVVVVEEALLARPRVLVGAGTPGVEIGIDPRVLLEAVGGRAAPVTGSGARTGAGRADVGGGG